MSFSNISLGSFELLCNVTLLPITKGHTNFANANPTSCAVSVLVALAKPNGVPSPIQIPYHCSAITISSLCSSVFK